MTKLMLDWSVVDCDTTETLFNTKEDVRQLRQDLEKATNERFDQYEQNQRKAWEKAEKFFLD